MVLAGLAPSGREEATEAVARVGAAAAAAAVEVEAEAEVGREGEGGTSLAAFPVGVAESDALGALLSSALEESAVAVAAVAAVAAVVAVAAPDEEAAAEGVEDAAPASSPATPLLLFD